MKDFAWIQTAHAANFYWGEGPFTEAAQPLAGRSAFYIQDFWGSDPCPWKHPAHCREVNVDELGALLEREGATRALLRGIVRGPDENDFHRRFALIQESLQEGDLRKLVPVVVEDFLPGDVTPDADLLLQLALNSLHSTVGTPLRPYGYCYLGRGVVGATPELLFATNNRGELETMALAGTRPLEKADELLSDAKELHEHELVVADIVGALAERADCQKYPIEILRLPRLAHLLTRIRICGPLAFDELVRILHPTAALGYAPRSAKVQKLFRELRGQDSAAKYFGAPFGFLRGPSDFLCLVAIRNAEITGQRLTVTAGCGIVEGSRVEQEWKELALKRASVRSLLGMEVLES